MRNIALIPVFALAFWAGAPAAHAQERAGLGMADARIDQFVTTQDSATGFGGNVADAEAQLDESDRRFLVEAHQLEMLQVHASALALKQKTAPQAVQSHARRVLQAHQTSLIAIEKIGREHDVELEREFTPEFASKAEALQQASPSSFGAVFFGQMLELHARTVALYEQVSSTSDDADVHSLVEDSLPTLRSQLADAEEFSTTLAVR